jgi:hypothetical protein
MLCASSAFLLKPNPFQLSQISLPAKLEAAAEGALRFLPLAVLSAQRRKTLELSVFATLQ